uniref:Fatty acyl-CoA reductase n=1 Tax=Strigamia maritima TaxID=126957 RepID=T1JLW2_STRMM
FKLHTLYNHNTDAGYTQTHSLLYLIQTFTHIIFCGAIHSSLFFVFTLQHQLWGAEKIPMANSANSTATSSIIEFYRDRNVLITGSTGFMGKVLVEKLLRCCPNVRNVYLLMRPKKGQDVRQRLDQLILTKLFEKVKREQPEVISKLVPIRGDISQPQLGLSSADTQLLIDNVSVVFHSAATVKFDEPLNVSVQMNVLGTRRLIELCHKMKNLVSLVHVSTAYANCDRTDIDEIVYRPNTHPQKLIDALEWMNDDMVKCITPALLGERPNTYTYTKALAEYVLVEEGGNLPVAIVRPSIVTAAWKEPIPVSPPFVFKQNIFFPIIFHIPYFISVLLQGWIDNYNGPTGLVVAVGKGVVRSVFCYRENVADLIPVDIPINLMLAVAWHTATHRSNQMQVYNCTSGSLNKLTWSDIHRYCFPAFMKYALNRVLWYPQCEFRNNRVLHVLDDVLDHYVPAYIIDNIAKLTGRKTELVAMHRKVSCAMNRLEYFTTHQWNFANDNIQILWNKLETQDKNIFYFNVRDVPWPEYLDNYCLGCKVFLLKEDLSSLPTARTHLKRMLWAHRIWTLLKIVIACRLLMRWSVWARRVWWFFMSLAFRLLQSLSSLKLNIS